MPKLQELAPKPVVTGLKKQAKPVQIQEGNIQKIDFSTNNPFEFDVGIPKAPIPQVEAPK